MICHICRARVPEGTTTCPRCRTTLSLDHLPPELAREEMERRRAFLAGETVEDRSHTVRTTVAGIFLCIVFAESLAGVLLFNDSRRDALQMSGESATGAHESSLGITMLLAIPVGIASGAAMGYIIGSRRLHLAGGIATGAGVFAAAAIILSSAAIGAAARPWLDMLLTGAAALVPGAMLGGVLSWTAGWRS